jgi:transcriptional regulator with XRE-family HTH domain
MPKKPSQQAREASSAKAATELAERDGRRQSGPQIGNVIRRLRRQRGLSLRQVAESAQLSASFLGAVERGESDISVGRLALVADVLGHDVASLLGYSLRQSRPRFIRPDEQIRMRRGKGIELTAMRIPGTNLELLLATLAPHSKDRPVTHAGLDILLVLEGNLVLRLDDTDYPMAAGECAVWPSSHQHAIRNDANQPARAIGLVTETVY